MSFALFYLQRREKSSVAHDICGETPYRAGSHRLCAGIPTVYKLVHAFCRFAVSRNPPCIGSFVEQGAFSRMDCGERDMPFHASAHFRHFDGRNNVSSPFPPLRFDGISENSNFFDRILFIFVYIIFNYFVFSDYRNRKFSQVCTALYMVCMLVAVAAPRKERLNYSGCAHFAQSFAQLGCQRLFRIACISCLHNPVIPLCANCAV